MASVAVSDSASGQKHARRSGEGVLMAMKVSEVLIYMLKHTSLRPLMAFAATA